MLRGSLIGALISQYDGPNYYLGDDGNTAWLIYGLGMADSIAVNAWYLQVANESGPLEGNFSVTQNVTNVVQSSNTYDVSPTYTWTTNSSGGFIDYLGVAKNGNFQYMQNVQSFAIDGAPANAFFQFVIYQPGFGLIANPAPVGGAP